MNCHICYKDRPESCIATLKKDVSSDLNLPKGVGSVYIRYCNDNPECFKQATTIPPLDVLITAMKKIRKKRKPTVRKEVNHE